MDLNRLPNDKKLQLCKWYFKACVQAIKYLLGDLEYGGPRWVEMVLCGLISLSFVAGCILLPFVWAVNSVWFFKEAFVKPPFEEQKQIKKYVILSGAGTLAWAAVLATWVVAFQLQRVAWGATGDALSFIVPLGRA